MARNNSSDQAERAESANADSPIHSVIRPRPITAEAEVVAGLGTICEILHRHTGHDFSHYKQPTLVRRTSLRIQLNQSASVSDYVQLLERSSIEADELRRDLLIGVTHFFRDPEVFEALATIVLPSIANRTNPPTTLRIWIPGCASGEEAYSVAIVVKEYLERTNSSCSVRLFATDIDGHMLDMARRGRYPLNIAEQVQPERLTRYFVRDGDSYQVTRDVRTLCTFCEHNLIRDPPFSSIDLISCRNLLIYLTPELQASLVPLFHFALRPSGYLLLGPTESLAAHSELFFTVDQHLRLFSRNDHAVRPLLDFPLTSRTVPVHASRPVETSSKHTQPSLLSHGFERMIIEDHVPPCAVVNEAGDILYMAGRIARFLRVAAGYPSHNIADLADGTLRIELRNALERVAQTRVKVVRDCLFVELDDQSHCLRLIVRPLPGTPAHSNLFALVLQPVVVLEHRELEPPSTDSRAVIEQVETELRTTRSALQSTMQNLEAANEELKSSNEELLSTNEELKSANEELQTSQEELRAVNEKLASVNVKLELKVEELAKANADLSNLFASTNIAALFLDEQLCITRFTPAAAQLLSLLEVDLGRPLYDLREHFVDYNLVADAREVLRSSAPVERQVCTVVGQRWHVLRALPYRDDCGATTGVSISFVDVTALKEAEEAARRRELLLRAATEAAPDPVYLKDREGRILLANPATLEVIGKGISEVIGRTDREVYADRDLADAITANDRRIMSSGVTEAVEEQVATAEGLRTFLSTKAPYRDDEGNVVGLVGISRDITARKQSEEALRETSLRLQLALHTARAATWNRDVATGNVDWSPNAYELLGLEPGTKVSLDTWGQLIHPDDAASVQAQIATALEEKRIVDCTYRIVTPGGDTRWMSAVGQGIYDDDGGLVRVTGLWWDVTERVRIEEERHRAQEKLARAQRLESLATLARGIAHDFNNLLGSFFGIVALARDSNASHDHDATATYLDDALKTVDRARGLTRQLITFAKGGEPRRVPTDMEDFVRNTIQFTLSGSNVLADFRAAANLWRCEVDPTQIGQVIDNLAINARQAMPGGGTLAISLENATAAPNDASTLAPGRYVRLTVADSGPGIAPENLNRIFDPFFSTKSGNTGLGLATSYSIVQRHGGSIEVESEPGYGAVFRVHLPAAESEAPPSGPPKTRPVKLTERRVLVMDDQEQVLKVTGKLLGRWGAQVTMVPGGASAIEEYKSALKKGSPFDFVILDLTIPGEKGGADVLAQLRAIDTSVRAIAASGYADDPIMANPAAFGFTAALCKPFTVDEMQSAVLTVLRRREA